MKLLLVVGTRPEAVKMAGLVAALRRRPEFEWRLCTTGQHGRMLEDILSEFDITPDFKLELPVKEGRTLHDLTASALLAVAPVIQSFQPDWVIVQGDTTTAMTAALAAFYERTAVAHVEAGLRTHDRYSPWPEEINRKLISAIASLHLAPTDGAGANLLAEGLHRSDVVVTGNTVIDALIEMRDRTCQDAALREALHQEFSFLNPQMPLVLVTGHRRESFGDGFLQICLALQAIARRGDVEIVYPVHLNPKVQKPVFELLGGQANVHLIEPQRYSRFVHLMDRATILLTDSGGVQEEGPALGRPILVMRDTSERPEAIDAGAARLVGANASAIVSAVHELVSDKAKYAEMARPRWIYGDGQASGRILDALWARRSGD